VIMMSAFLRAPPRSPPLRDYLRRRPASRRRPHVWLPSLFVAPPPTIRASSFRATRVDGEKALPSNSSGAGAVARLVNHARRFGLPLVEAGYEWPHDGGARLAGTLRRDGCRLIDRRRPA
jgi:hypothetical protein